MAEPDHRLRLRRSDLWRLEDWWAIRLGFIANLEAAGPTAGLAAAQLLASLKNTDDSSAHGDRVNAFIEACGARDKADFMADAMQVVSLKRSRARQFPGVPAPHLVEVPALFPADNLTPDLSTHFDPNSCELANVVLS